DEARIFSRAQNDTVSEPELGELATVAPRREGTALGEGGQLAAPEAAHQDQADVRSAEPLLPAVRDRALAGLGHDVLDHHRLRVVAELAQLELTLHHAAREVAGGGRFRDLAAVLRANGLVGR